MGYIVKRFLTSIPLLIIMTLLSFSIMQLAPGDPASVYMDPQMNLEDQAQLRENLGLNAPVMTQYWKWLTQVLRGNLGYSFTSGKPVSQLLAERLPATLILSCTGMVLIWLITLPLGLLSGAKKDSLFDQLTTYLSFIGMSLPTFWLGLILIIVFSLKLNLFPTSGYLDPLLENATILQKTASILYHMALPLLTILIGGIAGLTRYSRFAVLTILNQDFIKFAKSRGISKQRILFKHAFKNAALPLITLLGLSLPGLISGSYVIEYIFSWPGMGQLGIQAVFARDYPVLMGTILWSSLLIIIGNLLADISYQFIDPRLRKPD